MKVKADDSWIRESKLSPSADNPDHDQAQEQEREDVPKHITARFSGKSIEVLLCSKMKGTFTLVTTKERKVVKDKAKPDNPKKKAQHSKVAPIRVTSNGKDMQIPKIKPGISTSAHTPLQK